MRRIKQPKHTGIQLISITLKSDVKNFRIIVKNMLPEIIEDSDNCPRFINTQRWTEAGHVHAQYELGK